MAEVVDCIHLKPGSVNYGTRYNKLERPRKGLQEEALPTLGSQTSGFDLLLIKLVNAMSKFYNGPDHMHKAIYIKLKSFLTAVYC